MPILCIDTGLLEEILLCGVIVTNEDFREHKEAGKKIHPHTARQVISKARLGLLPNVPNFLKDLPRVIVDFPEAYKKCYFRSFFTENNKVGVVFTSLKLLEAIGHFDTTELYIDGTFNARPKKPTSAQLLVIQIRKRNMVSVNTSYQGHSPLRRDSRMLDTFYPSGLAAVETSKAA
ncbi:hypothetical protein PV328_008361 [Microctonus aethiopoides]|uniref:Uncharacterized protein n=1 Tax=Microctonus aethiopoides TaxID=144406 RepID=A0AA39FJ64_9HYME|nr:hypothetical protein PV328_008361 [Microctonus aethiopoides]